MTSGPARVILSKASRAAASLFSLPYPAALQPGWLHLRTRNIMVKEMAVLRMTDWRGLQPEADFFTVVWLFFLATSQSTSSSTLSTCDMTSSCSIKRKWMMAMEVKRTLFPLLLRTLTATVVAVFVLTMAKWHCLSTSASWSHTQKMK